MRLEAFALGALQISYYYYTQLLFVKQGDKREWCIPLPWQRVTLQSIYAYFPRTH